MQMLDAEGVTETFGKAKTVMLETAEFVQPCALLPVTVYMVTALGREVSVGLITAEPPE